MDPWPSLEHLKISKLNNIEQMLIATVHSFIQVHCIEGGGIGYKGQVLNVEQDVDFLVDQLLLLPNEIPCFIVRKPNQVYPNGFCDFEVNRKKIIVWLQFLHTNYSHYVHINIDAAIKKAMQLPENGSIAGDIRTRES